MTPVEYFGLNRPATAWPKAAAKTWPYNHRTLAEVMAAEEAERARKRIYARERYNRERKSLRGTA